MKTSRLQRRQERILKDYLASASGGPAMDFDSLPTRVQVALRRVKDQETLHYDVEGWLWDNANPHLRDAAIRKTAFSKNVANTKLAEARELAAGYFGRPVEEVLGKDFDKKYKMLQRATKAAPGIPRIQMPVIEPSDIGMFQRQLNEGRVDIIAPWAKGKFVGPSAIGPEDGPWVELGLADGSPNDDVVKAALKGIAVGKLKPTQGQIWLEKTFGNIAKFGVPAGGSRILTTTVIVSSDMYILDGHHRYSQAMLADPGLKMQSLFVPLGIKALLEIGRAYGEAIGNKGKQAKIASSQDLQGELRQILAYCQCPEPSRQALSRALLSLASRVAP